MHANFRIIASDYGKGNKGRKERERAPNRRMTLKDGRQGQSDRHATHTRGSIAGITFTPYDRACCGYKLVGTKPRNTGGGGGGCISVAVPSRTNNIPLEVYCCFGSSWNWNSESKIRFFNEDLPGARALDFNLKYQTSARHDSLLAS